LGTNGENGNRLGKGRSSRAWSWNGNDSKTLSYSAWDKTYKTI